MNTQIHPKTYTNTHTHTHAGVRKVQMTMALFGAGRWRPLMDSLRATHSGTPCPLGRNPDERIWEIRKYAGKSELCPLSMNPPCCCPVWEKFRMKRSGFRVVVFVCLTLNQERAGIATVTKCSATDRSSNRAVDKASEIPKFSSHRS